MANDRTDILFPAGRLIMGDCYKGSDKDSKGQPRVAKTGPNTGKPATQFFLGVAIPKALGEQAWHQTPWGQQILAVGAAAFPGFYQNPAFAWKVEDGDSTVPNKSNKRPCDSEGAPGHWVVKFSSQFAPKIFQQPTPGTFVEVSTPDAVKRGYWIQVSGNVAGNRSTESPGVFVNHSMVLFVRPDVEITSGPDAATAFAGAAVSQVLPGVAATVMPFGAPVVGLPAPATLAPPALVVAPNPGFLAGPGAPAMPGAVPPGLPMAPAMPAAPVAPSVPVGPQMTAAGMARGFTYAQYRTQGWTDEQLRANGIIT